MTKMEEQNYTLIIGRLTVQSSYIKNVERPATTGFDTIQILITPERDWRIKTYAIDQDIHVHEIAPSLENADYWLQHIQKHYGDVLDATHIIEIPNIRDDLLVACKLGEAGLNPTLEVSELGFAFWNPDDKEYKTRSHPV